MANNVLDINRISDYLYTLNVRDMDVEYAKEYFENRYIPQEMGGCSSVRFGKFYARNYDYYYNNNVGFVVSAAGIGRFRSIGVAGANPMLTKDFVESGEWYCGDVEPYKLIPFQMLDGVNEHGVFANINVVPTGEEGFEPTTGTNPQAENKMCIVMLVRYILDNFRNAEEIFSPSNPKSLVNIDIYAPHSDIRQEVHFKVGDREHTYAVEFINNSIEVTDISSRPYLTNFYLHGVGYGANGHVIENTVTPHGQGLERYNLIADNLNALTEPGSIMTFMAEVLKCTNAYTWSELSEVWKTEFTGNYGEQYGDLTVLTPIETYQESGILDAVKQKYLNRSRDPESPNYGTWHTVHTSLYDIENLTLTIRVQEGSEEYLFRLSEDDSNNEYGQFDGVKYFTRMAKNNRLCRLHNFVVTKVSGIGYLEQMLENFRDNSNFIGVEDTTSEQIVSNGNGYFSSRIFTVYVIAGYDVRDVEDHNRKADLCKEIKRQFLTRMLIDKPKYEDKLIFMDTTKVMGQGLGSMFLNGATGLYFQMAVTEPLELIYNEEEWETTT
ncbi:MAG: hypothetical protein MJZ08_02470 [Bacteroidaceae bacterium]|nr:hypothetical protein [Bacteroidaceae bacterium]